MQSIPLCFVAMGIRAGPVVTVEGGLRLRKPARIDLPSGQKAQITGAITRNLYTLPRLHASSWRPSDHCRRKVNQVKWWAGRVGGGRCYRQIIH